MGRGRVEFSPDKEDRNNSRKRLNDGLAKEDCGLDSSGSILIANSGKPGMEIGREFAVRPGLERSKGRRNPY